MPNDKIRGRPLGLNKQTLIPKKGKDYAEVIFLGDVHYGSPQCDVPRFLRMVDYCNKSNTPVLLMGDLIELATRHSVGSGVYEQEFPGQTQYEQMVEWLRPLAKKKLILGSLAGNHEDRAYVLSGVDVSKAICRELGIPHLGHACWNLFTVENNQSFNGAKDKFSDRQSYSIYSLHGRSGARFDGTALLALERLAAPFHADVVCMGHMHKLVSSSILMQVVRNGRVVEHKKHLVITGSFLAYGGYAKTFGLPPSKLGSPKVKLFAKRHDVHISF